MGTSKQDNYADEVEDELYDEDSETIESNEIEEEDDDGIIKGNGNESVRESSLLDRVFNTEDLLYDLEKTMRGFTKIDGKWVYSGRPLARSVFISRTINSLRSIISSEFIISSKTTEEINFILLEKAKEITFSVYDEPSIDEEDVEGILNIHDHALQMFMGIVEGGRGNSTLRQISANIFHKEEGMGVKKDGVGIGWDGNNLIKIGGKLNN